MDQLHVTMDVPLRRDHIRAAVEGLARASESVMRSAALAGNPFPPLYDSGIKYRREPPGEEDWQVADKLITTKAGDCEDVAAYRVGELRVHEGEPARIDIIEMQPGKYHAIVQRADGSHEDPSAILISMERGGNINDMNPPKLDTKVRNLGSHCLGAMTIPLINPHTGDYRGDCIDVAELGFDPWSALASVAQTALSVVSDPKIASLLPAPVAAGLQMVNRLVNMSSDAMKQVAKDPRATDAQKQMASAISDAKKQAEVNAASAPVVPVATTPTDDTANSLLYWSSAQPTVSGWGVGWRRPRGVGFGEVPIFNTPLPGVTNPLMNRPLSSSTTATSATGQPMTVTVTGQTRAGVPISQLSPSSAMQQGYPPTGYPPTGYPPTAYPPPQYPPPPTAYPPPQYPPPPTAYPPPQYPYPYPPQSAYPPPQYPYPPPQQYDPYYPYDQYGYAGYPQQQVYVDPSAMAYAQQMAAYQAAAAQSPTMLSSDDLMAMNAWGLQSFAPGSYPGLNGGN